MSSEIKFYPVFFALFTVFACTEAPKSPVMDKGISSNMADSLAVADLVHNFYKWYDAFIQDGSRNVDYVDSRGKVSKLDLAKVNAYHAELMKSGFISKAYVENDMAYLKQYEATWQENNENGQENPLSGMDYDRIFCGQDWELTAYTETAFKAEGLGANQVKAVVGASKLVLAKENGQWLIAKITCE